VTEQASRPATLDNLKALLHSLNAHGVHYLLISRYGVAAHGHSRGTTGQFGLFQREAKYLMNVSSAGHGTLCVSVMLRDLPLPSSVRPNGVQSRPACAHS
jgi:hypothetical protein